MPVSFPPFTYADLAVPPASTPLGSLTLPYSDANSGNYTVVSSGGAFRTDTTSGHQAFFQAYDRDNGLYRTFATLTNGDTPTFEIVPPSGGTISIDATTLFVGGAAVATVVATAPSNATFVIQTPNLALGSAQVLNALSSGIMRVATTTGVITSLGDVLPVANGGTGGTGLTLGSVVFVGTSGVLSQDNTNLFWDATNFRLGVGINAPTQPLHIAGTGGAFNLDAYVTSATGPSMRGRKFRNTLAAPRRANTDDVLFGVNAAGGFAVDDSTAAVIGSDVGKFRFRASENYTSTNQGSYMEIQTTDSGGSTAAATRLTINSSGLSTPFSFAGSATTSELILYADGVHLIGDGNDVLAQRHAGTAQAFRVYNTFTTIDTAGEWLAIDWKTTSNVVNIQATKGSSSGTARVLKISYGGAQASPVSAISVPITSGTITFGGGITLPEAGDITIGTSTGSLIGQTASKIGFFGTGPIARAILATGTGKTVDNVITALQNLGLVKQS